MVGRTAYNMKYMDGHTKYVTTTNRFLKSGFPGANGIKTGFTNAAGDCLVASATRGLKTMIAVFYNDDYRWDDAQVWLEFGFSFYDPSELRDRPARPVNENLAKITERIRQNRETNSNLAALDKAVAERAKNISSDNGAEDKAETVSKPVDETADTAENDNIAAKTDTDKTVNDEPAEVQTDKDSDDVNDIYAYTESDDNADITEETNPALAQYVY